MPTPDVRGNPGYDRVAGQSRRSHAHFECRLSAHHVCIWHLKTIRPTKFTPSRTSLLGNEWEPAGAHQSSSHSWRAVAAYQVQFNLLVDAYQMTPNPLVRGQELISWCCICFDQGDRRGPDPSCAFDNQQCATILNVEDFGDLRIGGNSVES